MNKEKLYAITHTVIVVAFMILVGFVVYIKDNCDYLWLLGAILLYQPWYRLREIKLPEEEKDQANS